MTKLQSGYFIFRICLHGLRIAIVSLYFFHSVHYSVCRPIQKGQNVGCARCERRYLHVKQRDWGRSCRNTQRGSSPRILPMRSSGMLTVPRVKSSCEKILFELLLYVLVYAYKQLMYIRIFKKNIRK